MYEHTQIYKMYIKILRHGKRKRYILNWLTVKIFNIQDTMHLNKSKFGQSLRQSLVKKIFT
jgi:hypothetical protein